MIVVDLQRKIDGVLQERRELLEASAKLREEKLDLKEKLLSQFVELQKVCEEVSNLSR